ADAVHVGWVSASLAGAATWWASGMLLVGLSGASRELAEGVFQLVTAALLLYASHWLLASLSAKRLVSFLSARTMAAGSAAVILGAVPLTIWGAFQVPALGLYATREGLCAQALVVMALAGSALWTALRRDRHDGDAPGRHPSPATSTAR